MCEGTSTEWNKKNTKQYDMKANLGEKDIKKIVELGVKDANTGMSMPVLVNMEDVKKEIGNIVELENIMKEATSSH